MNVIRLDKKYADKFWQLRRQLFEELGEINPCDNVCELKVATKAYYLSHINKDLLCWGISDNGIITAIISLCLFERIPYHENLSGSEGYILNVYTCPDFRKKGYAESLVREAIKYADENNIKRLWLSSSKNGKKLYTKLGFVIKENEMELFL